jgi:hypothetical protein
MLFALLIAAAMAVSKGSGLASEIRFERDPVNSVTIGADTAVYSARPSSQAIRLFLLTHGRRDAIARVPKAAVVIFRLLSSTCL